MPRPPGLDKCKPTIGGRVRWWREHRGYKQQIDFARLVGLSQGGLSDLENDRTKAGKKLHIIAAKLKLNPHYLETGKGEPEADYPQEAPEELPIWPFADVPKSRIDRLNMIERRYAETRLLEALADIESERRKSKRTG